MYTRGGIINKLQEPSNLALWMKIWKSEIEAIRERKKEKSATKSKRKLKKKRCKHAR
jgi:hypothetical protein